jgi:hypothetical protein
MAAKLPNAPSAEDSQAYTMTAASLGARASRRSGQVKVGVAWLLAVLLACIGAPAGADQRIGAGGLVSQGNNNVDLSCTDLIIAGTLNVNQATYVNVRNVNILAGGVLNGGSGSITYSGSFVVDPGGQYNQQSAAVQRNPFCLGISFGADPVSIPALGNTALIVLAALLLWLASLILGEKGVLRHRGKMKGADK